MNAPTVGRQWFKTCALAWHDFIYEWPVSLCLVLALSSVLAPLLVLFGLRSGIVDTLTERLRADPVNREIVIRGNHQLDADWFDRVAGFSEVGFLAPRTRTLAATITLQREGGQQLQDVDMIPTAPGDPLVPNDVSVPAGLQAILLTATAAGKLGLARGDTLEAIVSRIIDGSPESVRLPLRVAEIVPETAFRRDAVFASVALLAATENYRDGYSVPELNAGGHTPPASEEARSFASARLYARSLDDVAPLADQLRAQGFDIVTRAGEIESVRAINRVLDLVFVVLAGLATLGFLFSLAASFWANVDRKRKEMALLRMVGLGTGPLIGFPAAQAVLVSLCGIALSGALYFAVASLFNQTFASELGRDEFVCRLRPSDAAVAGLATLVFAISASLIGGYRAASIDPAESIREP